ncbi:zinc finger C-x8-C-x5-C-x3-H type family protein [Striga asiatica]|uniref:Zinc finger C-x8-C-x5-C-x3-H type family protein n=1 Tax=Striga asiatica TaxID=4170 RepID=A0A5A7PUD1_STRAF|nr:zinc finger C-x8-C-x5-C-x3-H type family protein [Striga asiatica]
MESALELLLGNQHMNELKDNLGKMCERNNLGAYVEIYQTLICHSLLVLAHTRHPPVLVVGGGAGGESRKWRRTETEGNRSRRATSTSNRHPERRTTDGELRIRGGDNVPGHSCSISSTLVIHGGLLREGRTPGVNARLVADPGRAIREQPRGPIPGGYNR